MKLFKLASQGRAVELRAAQQMLMQFARLKSSQPIEGFGTSVIDRPALARHYRCVLVRESQVRQRRRRWLLPVRGNAVVRALLAGGSAAWLMGAALLLPVLVAYWEGRDLTRSPIGIISAGCLLMICGTAAVCVGWRHRRGSIMPSGVRATVTANVVLLVFFALELSDRVVRQEGRIFYWSTLLFLLAGLLFCGLLAAQRWSWWTLRGAFALAALWFLLFLAVIPFAPMQGGGGPVPWYGRLDMAGVTLAFASILACAYRSLGQSETRRYFGLLRTEE